MSGFFSWRISPPPAHELSPAVIFPAVAKIHTPEMNDLGWRPVRIALDILLTRIVVVGAAHGFIHSDINSCVSALIVSQNLSFVVCQWLFAIKNGH
jgi:hypothetical protein